MTDVLIDSVEWSVEVKEIDWWGAEDDNGNPEVTWIGHKSSIKTRVEAEKLRDLLKTCYRDVRIIKVVKYIED